MYTENENKGSISPNAEENYGDDPLKDNFIKKVRSKNFDSNIGYMETIAIDKKNKIYINTTSLYYLFDQYIDQSNGSTTDLNDEMRSNLKLDDVFLIDNERLHHIGNPTHSTCVYMLDDFVYYFNSGLGITKNHAFEGNYVFPKIFCFKKKISRTN